MCMVDYFILWRFIKIIQIYVNSSEFMGKNGVLAIKNVFTAIRVV